MVNFKEMHIKTRSVSDWQKLKVNNVVFMSSWESRFSYIVGENINRNNIFVRPVW